MPKGRERGRTTDGEVSHKAKPLQSNNSAAGALDRPQRMTKAARHEVSYATEGVNAYTVKNSRDCKAGRLIRQPVSRGPRKKAKAVEQSAKLKCSYDIRSKARVGLRKEEGEPLSLTTWASPGEQVTSALDRLRLNLNNKEQVKTDNVVKREPEDDYEDSDGHQLKDAVTDPIQVAVKYPIEDTAAEVDEDELNDPTMCAEYVEEIFEYYKVLELQTLPSAEYMDHQDDLDWEKRGKLIDWLINVSTHFHLRPETLFLAVNIIDRFLSQQVVPRDKLQLVGITAMLIACKYEEVQSRAVDEFVEFVIDTFPDEIHSSERYILVKLKFDLSYPNPMNFLRRISKADNYYIKTRVLGKYLMEVSLVDHRFLRYKQSHIAAAAMYLARMVLGRGPWNATLVHFAGYTEKQITPVFKLMIEYHKEPITHKAFFAKYTRMEYSAASILTREWVKQIIV